ncbi:MAG: efflux RND transporter periplasmic adaptor subunit [Kiritimatiellia bacterium]
MEAKEMAKTETGREKSAAGVIGSAIGVIVLVAAAATGGWVACEMWPKAAPRQMRPQQAAPSVAVRTVEERAYNLPEKFVAHAEPEQEVELLPQIDGYIKELKFKEGDVVKAGSVLYVIDDERYRAVVNQRKADLEAAEAEARRAQRYFERMQKADERGITQLERDNAEAGAEKARAAVLQAKANLVVAEYDLKKTKVIAPISGQIGKSSAYVGDYVAPSKGALARIVQIDPIRVSFPLTDRAYVAWRNAQLAGKSIEFRQRVVLPDGTVYNREGTWAYDDNTMSKETATIIMRLTFPNSDRLLVPNTYVTLLVDRKMPQKLLCVPQQAVVDFPGGNLGVWVLKEGDTVEQRLVKTLEADKGWTPVTEGLAAGERVVVAGTAKLRTGMKVTLAEATKNADLNADYKAPIAE